MDGSMKTVGGKIKGGGVSGLEEWREGEGENP